MIINISMNYILISPQFPDTYYKFAIALRERGFTVLGIGDTPYDQLSDAVKQSLKEYYYCQNMNDYVAMYKAVAFYAFKYGRIDGIESHNEWWLETDARLRTDFNIKTGVGYPEVQDYKAKSIMKRYFQAANVPSARWHLISDYESCRNFIDQVGYPVFVKPNVGVGSNHSYKITNEQELLKFFTSKHQESYIMEEFIDGQIVSYDGVCDSNGDVVFEASNVFPMPNYLVVNDMGDDMYYTAPTVAADLSAYGKRIVKAYRLSRRIFHLEFFRLNKDYPHLGKKGELVALEVNMRPAGGYTPEMISVATHMSLYEVWADVVAYDQVRLIASGPTYYVGAPSRRKNFTYVHSHEDVLQTYGANIFMHGAYAPIISDGMGDNYYLAKFDSVAEVEQFFNYVLVKQTIT